MDSTHRNDGSLFQIKRNDQNTIYQDDDSDFENNLENIIDFIFYDLKRFNLNIPKDILSIIIDDVLYDGRNFHNIRFQMHNYVSYCLEYNKEILNSLNNVILRQ